jgi:hypothetical protein
MISVPWGSNPSGITYTWMDLQVVKISSLRNLSAGLDEHIAAGTRTHGSLSIGTTMYWGKLNMPWVCAVAVAINSIFTATQ